MSTRHIPYPSDFEFNHTAAIHEERRRRALKTLDPDDVLAVIEDLLASEPDPAKHPLYPMVLWLLDQALTPGSGGDFWDAWKRLACQAIDRLVDEALSRGED
jgi:hypothetical protein